MTLVECLEHMLRDPAVTLYLVTSRIPTNIPFTEVSDPTRLCQAPLVSVLMRAYNAEKTIDRAIESIVTQQTDFPFELIIADDASTDGTPAVCEAWLAKHPDKIRILRAEKNNGLGKNDVLRTPMPAATGLPNATAMTSGSRPTSSNASSTSPAATTPFSASPISFSRMCATVAAGPSPCRTATSSRPRPSIVTISRPARSSIQKPPTIA